MGKIIDRRPDPLKRQIQRALTVRMPPIAENKHEAFALELKWTLERMRIWQILFWLSVGINGILAWIHWGKQWIG